MIGGGFFVTARWLNSPLPKTTKKSRRKLYLSRGSAVMLRNGQTIEGEEVAGYLFADVDRM